VNGASFNSPDAGSKTGLNAGSKTGLIQLGVSLPFSITIRLISKKRIMPRMHESTLIGLFAHIRALVADHQTISSH